MLRHIPSHISRDNDDDDDDRNDVDYGTHLEMSGKQMT